VKVSQIARKTKNAAKLFRTGVYPQATYGHQVTGLSPSQIRSLRTEAARSTGRMKPGRCTTTLIQFIHGGRWDPAVRVRQEVLIVYINFWQEHRDIQLPMGALWTQYIKTPPTWHNVTGVIGIVYLTVISLGLQACTPWCWFDPIVGNSWIIQSNGDVTEFLQFARERTRDQLWEVAATHYCGGGAKSMGIAPGSVERLLRALQRKKEWEAYGMAYGPHCCKGSWPKLLVFRR